MPDATSMPVIPPSTARISNTRRRIPDSPFPLILPSRPVAGSHIVGAADRAAFGCQRTIVLIHCAHSVPGRDERLMNDDPASLPCPGTALAVYSSWVMKHIH